MMNTFRYWHAQTNKKQLAQLQHDKAKESQEQGHVNDLLLKKDSALFGLDGINLPQNGRHSFLQRPWEHPRDDCARRWGNESCDRQMLGDSNHRNTLSTMLNLTESNTFKEFTWDETHKTFIDFLTTDRPEVLWLIRLQRKNPHQRLQKSIHTEELWMAEDTEGLRFELDDTVRFSSECLIVRNVFKNWSARNPEVQFCFPICSKALKTLLEKEPITFDDLKIVREISGQHVRNILEFDEKDSPAGGQREQHSLSEGCRNLLSLILRIVDEQWYVLEGIRRKLREQEGIQ